MEHRRVEGLRVAFRLAGEGPPLVLLHGAFCDSRVWRSEIGDPSDRFTVVAWDAPGCGGSDDPPETFRLPEYADCLAGLIEALGLERPHVLGHSFGGGLALELYRRHSEVPRALVLAGAYAGWAGSLPAEEVEERLALALRQADRLPLRPESVPGLVSDATPAERVRELAAIMSDTRPAGMRAMVRGFAEADLRDVLPRIAVPILLLYGDADQRSPREVAEALHAGIPASVLVMLPGIGHMLFLEAPEACAAQVRGFLGPLDG